jgi:hypothetical protein
MRAMFQQWIAESQLTMRRDFGMLAIVVALVSAACGGTTATSYTPACGKPKACIAVAYFSKSGTDYANIPQGVFNDVPINTMACNSACQTESGIIDNYLLLGNTAFDSWVEVGETDGAFLGLSGPYYYEAAYIAKVQVSYVLLGGGSSGDYGQTGDLSIHFINSSCTGAATGLTEGGTQCPATTTPTGVYYSVSAPSATHAGTLLFSGGKTITPGGSEFGMRLQGTQGESATARLWDSGSYAKLALSANDITSLGSGSESSTSFPHSFINGGSVLNPAPPFGAWIGLEGDAYIWFETWCCS